MLYCTMHRLSLMLRKGEKLLDRSNKRDWQKAELGLSQELLGKVELMAHLMNKLPEYQRFLEREGIKCVGPWFWVEQVNYSLAEKTWCFWRVRLSFEIDADGTRKVWEYHPGKWEWKVTHAIEVSSQLIDNRYLNEGRD